jgi:phospho-N-acetylmuramoyl-pentapeptide-transferase
MLVWLLQHFAPVLEQLQLASSGDSRVFLTARAALAAVTSFLVAMIFGPIAIRWLNGRFRERVDSASSRLNELHAAKNATPTMGGVFIVAAIIVAALVCADLSNPYVQLALLIVGGFAAIGIADDWIKISTARRGLTVRQKFLAQLFLAAVVVHLLVIEQRDKPHGLDLIWPFGMHGLFLGGAFAIWGTFVIVGSSNGVNLTDGLDGLAGGCLVFAGAAFVALTYLSGHRVMADYLTLPYFAGAGELSVLFAALVGAMLGFLWYNCYPAQVFMGDSGSLPTGALLGFGALVTRQEVLLLIVGGVFVVETLSVILQVAWFKATGKRLIACSPLHNHFLFRGDHEIKIVVRFWITSALLALLGVASLKIQ